MITMEKKYIVRLSAEERTELQCTVKKLKGTSQKVRRAQILLKADAGGSNWTDQEISEAYGCRVKTRENIRQRHRDGRVSNRPQWQETRHSTDAEKARWKSRVMNFSFSNLFSLGILFQDSASHS